MRVGVLALQGAFIEHEQMLQHIGVEAFEIRQLKDFQQPIDRLIIPGGESTTLRKLLKDTGLFTPIRERILDGMPVLWNMRRNADFSPCISRTRPTPELPPWILPCVATPTDVSWAAFIPSLSSRASTIRYL